MGRAYRCADAARQRRRMTMLDKQKPSSAGDQDKPVKDEAKENREEMKKKTEDDVVVTSDDSFPASDPPSWTSVGGVGSHKSQKK